jgi:hypothetical protein
METSIELVEDVITWLKWPAGSRPVAPEGETPGSPEWVLLASVVEAVVDYVGQHYTEPVAGEDDPEDEPVPGLASYRLGVVMQSGRLWKRRDTPEGVAGVGTDAPIHITKIDPDVERLLSAQDPWAFS